MMSDSKYEAAASTLTGALMELSGSFQNNIALQS